MPVFRRAVTIDRDSVSPDSIRAAMEYLVEALVEQSANLGLAVNWNTFRVYTRRNRAGEHRIIARIRVMG